MTARPRDLSRETLQVLAVILEDRDSEFYGLEISSRAGLPSGSLYPILARLERQEMLSSRWETDVEAVGHRGRRRRYYRLTGEGARSAEAQLAQARRELTVPSPRLRLRGATS